jgi:outer membrane immunogenic protein
MRKYIIINLLCCLLINASAQSPIKKDQAQLNAGLGFSSWGIPLYLGLDYGIHDDITIGGELSIHSYNTALGLSANGNYHFNRILELPSEWDFYAGLNMGFYYWNTYRSLRTSGLGIGIQVGGRYYINEKVSLNLEFGGGNAFSGGRFGVTIKL